jgi:hypothetical protein
MFNSWNPLLGSMNVDIEDLELYIFPIKKSKSYRVVQLSSFFEARNGE